nr:TonB-dependent receptor [Prevotella sp.]
MKQVKFKLPLRTLAIAGGLFLSTTAFAQSSVIKGQVRDASGDPVIGASITVKGMTVGITDLDGNYSINVPKDAELTFTYVGMLAKKVSAANNLAVTLQADEKNLKEVVVIGYGAVKKSDLTGSITAIKADSKNKGLVINPQDMLAGKVAGLNVTSEGGTPGGGSKIRIRGGSSLSGSNDPLIVIDGIAMDNNGVKGLSNPLSMVNPQDIESFSILKDASATAIYGSRGSNGVIIITTKKGHKNFEISYNGSFTVSKNKKTIDVMSGDEYRDYIAEKFGANSSAYKTLGTANTDWQDEIMRTAYTHDHNVNLSGQIGSFLPYRISAGYTNEQGIVKTSDFERYTAAVNLSPSFFKDHLKINLNVKGMWAKSRYADGDALRAAVVFDPTQSVRDYTSSDAANFGNYFEWKDNGTALNNPKYPNTYYSLGTKNPVADLELKNDRAISRDLMTSGDIDYKVHGFEDLHIHATGGIDISQGKQNTDVDPTCPLAFYYGSYGFDNILKRNFQGSVYALYNHDFDDKANNHIDLMAGAEETHNWRSEKSRYYSYSDAWNGTCSQIYTDSGTDYDKDGTLDNYQFKTENYLVSYFGRANWSLMDRYFLTGTFRRDGSSRFKKHYSSFPSVAFMWKVKDENKFKDVKWLSDLKFRLGWGMTGQQEFSSDYNYFATYAMNSGVGSYYDVVGNGDLARPTAYNPDLKWETTTTYNIGLDWGILNHRITGTFDWYYRGTKDLLNYVTVPAGSNFRNQLWSNIGEMQNMGCEATLKIIPIVTKDFNWTIDYNFTYNSNKITKLNSASNSDDYVATGGISAGTGVTVQAQHVGTAMNAFYVYQQAYDKNGKAIEGVVVDRNADGQITDADKYYYKSPNAPITMGLSSRIEYKSWDLGFSLRASIGNYVYNDLMAAFSNCNTTALYTNNMYLTNRPVSVISDNWQSYDNTSTISDRWIQNASFLKCDNITLGYSFSNLFRVGSYHGLGGRIYGTVNNVFTITDYDGIDPEVFGGLDNTIYPRPISFILGLSLNF